MVKYNCTKNIFYILTFYDLFRSNGVDFILWRSGAVAARLAHNQEDGGASPSSATSPPELPEWDPARDIRLLAKAFVIFQ